MTFAQEDGKVAITSAASYEQLNKQVETFNKEGLPKSAISTLDIIMQKAEKENNFAEYLNALKLWAGHRMDISPDSILPDIQRMEQMLSRQQAQEDHHACHPRVGIP